MSVPMELFSLNHTPQEYSMFGVGDYRTDCLRVVYPNGGQAVDLRYDSHKIYDGKPQLKGLPAVYCGDENAQTLEIVLKDCVSEIRVVLLYSVFENYDMIARSARIENGTQETVFLDSALTGCIDYPTAGYDLLTFYGRHAKERSLERTALRHGKIRVDSVRGASSHQQNPFAILCDPNTDETKGECYGFSLLYSGNFAITAEVDQLNRARIAVGINPDGFYLETKLRRNVPNT